MRVATTAALFFIVGISPALAHGELDKTTPVEGADLGKPPAHVIVTLTEAPSKGAVLRVLDGCKENQASTPLIEERSLHSVVNGGEPGTWTVSYRVVSAEDGHLTKGTYTFKVKGSKDCSGGGGNDTDIGQATTPITPDPASSEDSFPVLPVAIGGAVVLLAAIAIRAASSRSGS
jgi:copper resistance protein C